MSEGDPEPPSRGGVDPRLLASLPDGVSLDDLSMEEMREAFELLETLGRALFPDGPPSKDRVTWADEGGAPKADAEPHDPRARALERLEAAERRFKTLVEQIPAVTFMAVLGEGDNEVYVSPHIEQLLGYTQEEWLSDPFLWYWRLHPADRQLWNEEFARGTRTGGPFKAECRFIARDGRIVWVHGEARVIKDERGRPQYLQGVAFDITESKNAQQMLLEHAVEDARLDEEKAIARRLQVSLLPTRFDIPNLEVDATMIPASEVGGDYYDYHRLEGPVEGAWLAVGDVSGHGLDAGLIMMMVQSAFASLVRARPHAPPSEHLVELNEVLYDNICRRLDQEQYITLCLLRYLADGRVTYAGAHEHILVRRAKTARVEWIVTPGVWCGLRPDIGKATRDSELQLEDGDVMVLFTDGVIEAVDAAGEQFDMDRLVAAIEDAPDTEPATVRASVLAALRAFAARFDDDITLLIARHTRR